MCNTPAVHYPVPFNKQPAMATREFGLSVAEKLTGKGISLPIHPPIAAETQVQVVVAMTG